MRGILNVAKELGLLDKIKKMGVQDIEVKHVGLAASGINPADATKVLPEDSEIRKLSMKVWEIIEKREAQHIILLHRLTGKTQFAFGGGTTAGNTGEIRQQLLQKFVDEFRAELGITEDITVTLVQTNAAWGAALKAAQLVSEVNSQANDTRAGAKSLPESTDLSIPKITPAETTASEPTQSSVRQAKLVQTGWRLQHGQRSVARP